MKQNEITPEQRKTVQELVRSNKAFCIPLTFRERALSLAFVPVESTISTLGIAPLAVSGYLVLVRDVNVLGNWTTDKLLERSYSAGTNNELAHLFRGEAVEIWQPRFVHESNGVMYAQPEIGIAVEWMGIMGHRERNALADALLDQYDLPRLTHQGPVQYFFADVWADEEPAYVFNRK